ncbi:MAG: 1-phosphofructokinase [Deltaproteobacteria bacterium]|jgi:1-phosphofructokinase|nr:1-phosphofructokinase [Deltaproteobacteria bacterium]
MIYTLTLNPALDYLVNLESLIPGSTNRSIGETIIWGGKGINVSRVLFNLGFDSVTLGFIAGFTGEALKKGLLALGLRTDFIELERGLTRINVKVKAKEETEINGSGPLVSLEAIETLMNKVAKLNKGDTLIMAGNIPPNVGQDIYERLLVSQAGHGVRVVIDTSGPALKRVLKHQPTLVKPNINELNEICDKKALSDDQIIENAKRLQEMGAQNVLVSMAGAGALLVQSNGQSHRVKSAQGQVKNSAGAGDSLVAGFLAGLMWDLPPEGALALGAAAGSATAFSEGLASREAIEAIYKETYGLSLPIELSKPLNIL